MEIARKLALEIHHRLLQEYGQPIWRVKLPPLGELVSTILSQNTNDINRDRAFKALIDRFPDWDDVRLADPQAVIDAIRPAGLSNQKGPRIQAALQNILSEQGSLNLNYLRELSPPEAMEALQKLKGVGPKTAAIVLLFSLDMPAFPVDTHIHRVTGRIGLLPAGMNAEKAHEFLAAAFPPDTYYTVHLNIIQHGREICQSRKPRCDRCLLQDICAYYAALPL